MLWGVKRILPQLLWTKDPIYIFVKQNQKLLFKDIEDEFKSPSDLISLTQVSQFDLS